MQVKSCDSLPEIHQQGRVSALISMFERVSAGSAQLKRAVSGASKLTTQPGEATAKVQTKFEQSLGSLSKDFSSKLWNLRFRNLKQMCKQQGLLQPGQLYRKFELIEMLEASSAASASSPSAPPDAKPVSSPSAPHDAKPVVYSLADSSESSDDELGFKKMASKLIEEEYDTFVVGSEFHFERPSCSNDLDISYAVVRGMELLQINPPYPFAGRLESPPMHHDLKWQYGSYTAAADVLVVDRVHAVAASISTGSTVLRIWALCESKVVDIDSIMAGSQVLLASAALIPGAPLVLQQDAHSLLGVDRPKDEGQVACSPALELEAEEDLQLESARSTSAAKCTNADAVSHGSARKAPVRRTHSSSPEANLQTKEVPRTSPHEVDRKRCRTEPEEAVSPSKRSSRQSMDYYAAKMRKHLADIGAHDEASPSFSKLAKAVGATNGSTAFSAAFDVIQAEYPLLKLAKQEKQGRSPKAGTSTSL